MRSYLNLWFGEMLIEGYTRKRSFNTPENYENGVLEDFFLLVGLYKKWKNLLTNEESGGMISKLRLGNQSGRKTTSKKVEKSPWHLRTTVIRYQSCFWKKKVKKEQTWKKLKKFLTNRKQHDKMSKLSKTAQVSEAHKSVCTYLVNEHW